MPVCVQRGAGVEGGAGVGVAVALVAVQRRPCSIVDAAHIWRQLRGTVCCWHEAVKTHLDDSPRLERALINSFLWCVIFGCVSNSDIKKKIKKTLRPPRLVLSLLDFPDRRNKVRTHTEHVVVDELKRWYIQCERKCAIVTLDRSKSVKCPSIDDVWVGWSRPLVSTTTAVACAS